jgi:hypothetical protein
MSGELPDGEIMRAAMALAGRAPSVHNSQPWKWRVGIHDFHLHADPTMLAPGTDPDGRDLLLSCGATLHHCTVALAALGWNPKVHRFPDPTDPNYLAVIEFSRREPTDLDVTLAAAIPRRRSDRRNYSPWAVPMADIGLMGARAARAGVMMRQVESLPDLQKIVAEAVFIRSAHERPAERSRFGSLATVSTASDPAVAIPGGRYSRDPADDKALVLALGTKDDSPLSRLRAGEATSLVLLTATAQGLASCAVTEPLKVSGLRAQVADDVFGGSGDPQVLVRVGWAHINAEPLLSTPRRPIKSFCECIH